MGSVARPDPKIQPQDILSTCRGERRQGGGGGCASRQAGCCVGLVPCLFWDLLAHQGHLFGGTRGGGGLSRVPVKGKGGGGVCPHSPGTPTTGLRERGNNTSRSTGRSGQQNAATRHNMRREERVTAQGPVKKQQPDGMSHRGSAPPAVLCFERNRRHGRNFSV